jgi:uncharacterized RDD family membrane protein YckC
VDYNEEFDTTATYELAGIGARFVASLIDGLILTFTIGLISVLLFRNNAGISTLLYFLYYGYCWTQRDGQTPGKQAMNIKIIKTDGSSITWADALLRYVGYLISSLVFGLGYIWAFFDANHQAWHDKIAKTYVVVAGEKKKKRISV